MGYLDIVIVGFTALGLVLGYLRGFGAEMRALLGWVIAFYGTRAFAPWLALQLPASLPPSWLLPMSSVILFVGLRIAFSLVAALLFSLFSAHRVMGLSRSLGALIGVGRAIFQLMVTALVFTWMGFATTEFWQSSHFLPLIVQLNQRWFG